MKTKIPANNYEQAAKELEAIDKGLSAKVPNEIDENDNGHFTVALVRSSDNPVSKKYDHKVNVQQLNVRAFEKMESNLAVTGFDKMIIIHNPDPSHNRRATKVVTMEKVAHAPINPPGETPAQIEARIRKEYEDKFAGFVPGTQSEQNDGGGAQPLEVIVAEFESRLKAEFEVRFGPDTETETIKTEDFVGVTQDDATLKIYFNNPDVIVDDADDANVTIIGDFTNRSTVAQLQQFADDNKIDLTGVTGKDNILSALEAWKADNVK